MSVRAVVFDYGMVLSGPPHPPSRDELMRVTGLSEAQFERYYWADRHAYDRGDLTGLEFWEKLSADAGLGLSAATITQLNGSDAAMWSTENAETLAWHRALKASGIRTGILSNMGDSVLESIEAKFAWVNDFDVLIWSYQHNLAKPEAAIYELLLKQMATEPGETLFLDDKIENIEAARQHGILGLVFTTVTQLRLDLIANKFDEWLPLPVLID